jgi:hypothetical protein
VRYVPLGKETMAAVTEELESVAIEPATELESVSALELDDAQPTNPRIRQNTKDYSERREASPVPPVHIYGSAPEITVVTSPAGRETLAAINEELLEEPLTGVRATLDSVDSEATPLEFYEMVTFVVKGARVEQLSPSERRAFVLARLGHRLPIESAADIDRIELTPWTVRGMMVLRIWCRVPLA